MNYIKADNAVLDLLRSKKLCSKSFYLWCFLRQYGTRSYSELIKETPFNNRKYVSLYLKKLKQTDLVTSDNKPVDSKPESNFFVVPKYVIDLTTQQKLGFEEFTLFCYISRRSKCYANTKTIGSTLRVKPTKVIKLRETLEELDLIKIQYRSGRTTDVLEVDWQSLVHLASPYVAVEQGIDPMQGFLNLQPDDNQSKLARPTEFDIKASQMLLKAIAASGRLQTQSVTSWPAKLAQFRNKHNIDEKQIKETISYLFKNKNSEYCPRVYSMRSYIEKFDQIKDAVIRLAESQGRVELTPEEAAIMQSPRIAEVAALHPGIAKYLPKAVQQTRNNYIEFMQRMKKFVKKTKKDENMHEGKKYIRLSLPMEIRQFLASQQSYSPDEFVISWFEMIYQDLKKIPRWNGSLKKYIFDATSDRVLDFVSIITDGLFDFQVLQDRWTAMLYEMGYDVQPTTNGPVKFPPTIRISKEEEAEMLRETLRIVQETREEQFRIHRPESD